MKILLLNPSDENSLVCPPLSLLYLAANLDGHKVEVVDPFVERMTQDDVVRMVARKKPDLVGITTFTPSMKSIISLSDALKAETDSTIVLGGPHPTLLPEETLGFRSVDYVFRGEAEASFPKFVDILEKGGDLSKADNLSHRRDGKMVHNKMAPLIQDLDSLPLPARHLIDISKYYPLLISERKPVTTMLTSRGCPFRCIYCSKPIFGKEYRARSPENVVGEIEFLKERYGIRELIFYDDIFPFNRKRTAEICRLMIERDLDVKWKCEARVNLMDAETLKLMKKAGCYLIAYGIESGNQDILDTMKKDITLQNVRDAVGMTKKAGIKVLGYFMMGVPGETEAHIRETMKFAKGLRIDYAQFSVATPYPGTELYEIARSMNLLESDWSKYFYALGGAHSIPSLCDVSEDSLGRLQKEAYRGFYLNSGYVMRKVLGVRSLSDLKYMMKGLGVFSKTQK